MDDYSLSTVVGQMGGDSLWAEMYSMIDRGQK